MFNKRRKEILTLKWKVDELEMKVWGLENPPKFSIGDVVFYKCPSNGLKKFKVIDVSEPWVRSEDSRSKYYFNDKYWRECDLEGEGEDHRWSIKEKYLFTEDDKKNV